MVEKRDSPVEGALSHGQGVTIWVTCSLVYVESPELRYSSGLNQSGVLQVLDPRSGPVQTAGSGVVEVVTMHPLLYEKLDDLSHRGRAHGRDRQLDLVMGSRTRRVFAGDNERADRRICGHHVEKHALASADDREHAETQVYPPMKHVGFIGGDDSAAGGHRDSRDDAVLITGTKNSVVEGHTSVVMVSHYPDGHAKLLTREREVDD